MLEGEPENDSQNGTGNGGTGKGPDKEGIADSRGGGETNSGGDGGHEQVDGGHQALHVLGRTRVGNSVGGDVDKDLGDGAQDDGDGVQRDRDGGEVGCSLCETWLVNGLMRNKSRGRSLTCGRISAQVVASYPQGEVW